MVTLQADDPTNPEVGAGAGSNFRGDEDAAKLFKDTAGVVEGRPGIIESTGLDPLIESSNKGRSLSRSCYVEPRLIENSRRWLGKRNASSWIYHEHRNRVIH
jgi:hypothetical protein